jgi:hypothetical protein
MFMQNVYVQKLLTCTKIDNENHFHKKKILHLDSCLFMYNFLIFLNLVI